ncbi:MAG: GNAT family N-acetyltransferase [Acidimicrobiia bacterium]
MTADVQIGPAAEHHYEGIHDIVLEDDVFPFSFCRRRVPSDAEFLTLLWTGCLALYVATLGDDDMPVGFGRLTSSYNYELVGEPFVAVSQAERGKGIGGALLDELTRVASDLLELRTLIGKVPEAHAPRDVSGIWRRRGQLRNEVYVSGEPTDLVIFSAHLRGEPGEGD